MDQVQVSSAFGKTIKYLSPTSLSVFEEAIDKFVLYYVVGCVRPPQIRVMAVGSAFDAYVKGALARDLFGEHNVDIEMFKSNLEMEFQTDEYHVIGSTLLKRYQDCGAYAHLRKKLESAEQVCCEASCSKTIVHNGVHIPLYGKPDLYYYIVDPIWGRIGKLLDWKVSGFNTKATPGAGYIRLYEKNRDTGAHKDTITLTKYGCEYGVGAPLKPAWSDQLHIYSWLIDDPTTTEPIPWVLGIDQLALANDGGKFTTLEKQTMRVASYRILRQDRIDLRDRLAKAWQAVLTGHYYQHLSKEENDSRIAMLSDADATLRWALTGL